MVGQNRAEFELNVIRTTKRVLGNQAYVKACADGFLRRVDECVAAEGGRFESVRGKKRARAEDEEQTPIEADEDVSESN